MHPCNLPMPRARIDPIEHRCAALAIAHDCRPVPFEPQTSVVLLDHQRRGLAITTVTTPPPDDDLVSVLGRVLRAVGAAGDLAGGVIVISYRPGALVEPDDEHNWHVADSECALVDIELVEWLVVGRHGVRTPRSATSDRARWRGRCPVCQP